MTKAWPLLRILTVIRWEDKVLSGEISLYEKPTATLYSLFAFANHCPSIEHIELPLDASGVIPGQDGSSLRVDTHNEFYSLNVCRTDVGKIRACLGRMFPRLETLPVEQERGR